jgi:hypothetical protein
VSRSTDDKPADDQSPRASICGAKAKNSHR